MIIIGPSKIICILDLNTPRVQFIWDVNNKYVVRCSLEKFKNLWFTPKVEKKDAKSLEGRDNI